MFVVSTIEALVDIAENRLAIHIGEMHFVPLQTCIILLALTAASLAALNLWRIGRWEDREKRLFNALRRVPFHPADLTRVPGPPWYYRLGTMVGATRIIGTAEQQKLLADLAAAGVKGCSGAAFVPLCWLLLEWRQFFVEATTVRLVLLAGAYSGRLVDLIPFAAAERFN